MARGLGRIIAGVDAHLSSPYSRAWRTAELLEAETDWPEPAALPALEPEIPPDKVVLALQTYADTESVALVGHRPCLHELASYLLSGDGDLLDVGLKKGGVMCLRFDDAGGPPDPGSARLRWLLTPKILRG